jgi:uncharacterized protein YjiK
MKKILYAAILFCFTTSFRNDHGLCINPKSHIKIHVAEPSDIIMKEDGTGYFIASDNGYLHETDLNGRITRTAPFAGYDFEGIYRDKEHIYISDETLREVLVYDIKTFELIRLVKIENHGGRNLGCESITFNPTTNHFIMATEKDPQMIYEMDENFQILNQRSIAAIHEISSATFYEGHLYFLSDEQMTVFELDPADFKIVKRWKIPVLNPEGICFNPAGELLIVSDDLAKLFNFGKLQ